MFLVLAKKSRLTADEVHKCEFINRLIADRYEVVLTTYVDKGHLHNHTLFNAVSFIDRMKYHSDFKDYLHRNNIETDADLADFKVDTERRITELVGQRKPLYRLSRTDDIVKRIDGINAELLKLLRDLWLCKGVEENSERVRSGLQALEAKPPDREGTGSGKSGSKVVIWDGENYKTFEFPHFFKSKRLKVLQRKGHKVLKNEITRFLGERFR